MSKFKQIKLIKGETFDDDKDPYYQVTLNSGEKYLVQRNMNGEWYGYIYLSEDSLFKTELFFEGGEEQAILWIIGKSFE